MNNRQSNSTFPAEHVAVTTERSVVTTERSAVSTCSVLSAVLISVILLAGLTTSSFAQVTPAGGQTDKPMLPGNTITIGWTRLFEDPMVDIFLWDANTSTRIPVARNIASNRGEYLWAIPQDFPNGTRYRFVVEPTMQRYRRMMSPGWLTISSHTEEFTSSGFVRNAKPSDQNAFGVNSDTNSSRRNTAVSITPQPALESVRIRINDDYTMLRVMSMDGKTHLSRALCEGERTVDLDVQDLAAGVYSIVLISDSRPCDAALLQISP